MSDQARDDWTNLVKSPGWLRLKQYAREQWAGNGYAGRLKLAIRDAKALGVDQSAAVAAVDLAQDEINRLLSYPDDLVHRFEREQAALTPDVSLSRRGTL